MINAMKWASAILSVAIVATSSRSTVQKEMTMTANGTFEVTMISQPADSSGGPFARFLLDKKFHGDLEGLSKGQMLASGGPPSRLGAYMAFEEVTGTLAGRRGSFVLIHRGMMSDDGQHLEVNVVPGSGTEELAGIAGSLTIMVEGAKHLYKFEYMLGVK
jgi:hypothetical protein